MNESTLVQLKIIAERAVRPVRASTSRKRHMREELLAHVSGVFEEESAKAGDDRVALEQTTFRFGNPTEVTSQLQESVPARDSIIRVLEGRPGESVLRGALRFAWIEGAIFVGVLAAVLFVAGWMSAWSRAELIALAGSFGVLPFWLCMPLWLVGIVLVAHWMEASLHGPEPLTRWPRIGSKKLMSSAWAIPAVRGALIVGGLCVFAFACMGGLTWPMHRADWNQSTMLASLLLAGAMAASAVVVAWILVQTVAERRRQHEEWSLLPIEGM